MTGFTMHSTSIKYTQTPPKQCYCVPSTNALVKYPDLDDPQRGAPEWAPPSYFPPGRGEESVPVKQEKTDCRVHRSESQVIS